MEAMTVQINPKSFDPKWLEKSGLEYTCVHAENYKLEFNKDKEVYTVAITYSPFLVRWSILIRRSDKEDAVMDPGVLTDILCALEVV